MVALNALNVITKGISPTLKTLPGKFPLVVTAEFRRSAADWQIEGPSVCVPLISSTGHGDASLARVHYQEGKFALANLLVALTPKDAARLSAKYLYWLLMAQKNQLLVPLMAGSANVSLKESDVAGLKIPLPPLAEQQAIVTRLDALAEKGERLTAHWQAIAKDAAAFTKALWQVSEVTSTPMSSLVAQQPPDVAVEANSSYGFAGVYSFGRGVFRGNTKLGSEFAYPRLSTVRAGNFIYPKLMAWEGAFGLVPQHCDGLVVSPEFPVFEVNRAKVLPEMLDIHFRDPAVWPTLAGASTGTNARRRRLNPSDFLRYALPLPSMRVQEQLRETDLRLKKLLAAQAVQREQLEQLRKQALEQAFN